MYVGVNPHVHREKCSENVHVYLKYVENFFYFILQTCPNLKYVYILSTRAKCTSIYIDCPLH